MTRLQAATEADPWSPEAWHHLGLVLRDRQEGDKAAHCLLRAAEIGLVHPIRPFTSLPYVVGVSPKMVVRKE